MIHKLVSDLVPEADTEATRKMAVAAFQTLGETLRAGFSGDYSRFDKARGVLDDLLKLVALAPEMSRTLFEQDDTLSPEAQEFVTPVRKDEDTVASLTEELEKIGSPKDLATWYEREAGTIRGIGDQAARNTLFDAIRGKKIRMSYAK